MTPARPSERFARLRALYRKTLLEDVVPFWMRHAVDADGGLNTCIADDGRVLSRDRWNWSQWRAVWTFSRLYNRGGGTRPGPPDVPFPGGPTAPPLRAAEARSEWLDVARGIYAFVTSHGPLESGHWPLLLDGDGRVRRGFESVYVDGFAIQALVEFWRAARETRALDLALATFRAAEEALNGPEPPPAWPYPIPAGHWAHGVSMIFSLACHELAAATGDPAVRAAADLHHRRVLDDFLRPDRGVVLEWLLRDGGEAAPPAGRAVVPGHAVESMWFQMRIARDRGDRDALDRAVRAIRRHLEIGWDPDYGGLFLAVDADGGKDVGWPFADAKLWWPHTEALVATLLAYEHCREPWCLEWHERIRDYAWAHFPDPAHGEWRQKLDRRGAPLADVVALPVKDPFHLPRSLMLCLDALERLDTGAPKNNSRR